MWETTNTLHDFARRVHDEGGFTMKIKVFSSMSEDSLAKKVNEFIDNSKIKVIKIDFTGSIFYLAAMVVYEESE